MGGKFNRVSIHFLCLAFLFLSSSRAQLDTEENTSLFELQKLLEYPEILSGWNNWTSFCSLPPNPSLVIVCSGNHITELTLVGNKTRPNSLSHFSISNNTLSESFSIDAFFTLLTNLSSLNRLTLVSMGLWGQLPEKVNTFKSLEVLNFTSNFIHGGIPSSISTIKNLTTLDLSNNLLNGSVPDLKGLESLQVLDLGNNHLGPQYPSASFNLLSISLKNNSFRSQIPSDFVKFVHLESLDISSNMLVGPIPSSLFSLSSIEFLNLANNKFSGEIPKNSTCNTNLGFVDVSNNLLIGKLPSCIGSNSTNRTVISSWNCLTNGTSRYQHPYGFCHKEALAVLPPEGGRSQHKKEDKHLKLGIVLGIIGGIVGIAGLIGVLILGTHRRSIDKRTTEYKSNHFVAHKNQILEDGRRPQTMRTATLGLPPYNIFTLEEIEDATDNFNASNLIEKGSQEQIYKGCLRDGLMVLIKCLKLKKKQSTNTLQQQMERVSKLRHRHLVSVLGHCVALDLDHPESGSIFLVLENVSDGSLKDHLTDGRKKEILKWPHRMGITLGIARGIQFLHTHGIFGNDLRIETVVLDGNLTAKISSYSIRVPSKVSSEGLRNSQATFELPRRIGYPEKEDIYRFGVIVLELITGKPINSKNKIVDFKNRVSNKILFFVPLSTRNDLANFNWGVLETLQLEMGLMESPARLREETDASIRGSFAYESLKTAVEITISCLDDDPGARPSIEDVLWKMQYSVQVQEGWNSSGNLSTKL